MQLSTILGAVALLASSVMASPLQTREEKPVARHTTVAAEVTDFKATRNATHINYSANIRVHEEDEPAHFSHATPSTKVPELSSMWDSSDPQLYFRFLRVPSSTGGPDRLRFVLSDVHKTGSTINLDYFSPVEEWEGKYRTVYTGPSKFTLKV